jgi:hypothetical protein
MLRERTGLGKGVALLFFVVLDTAVGVGVEIEISGLSAFPLVWASSGLRA